MWENGFFPLRYSRRTDERRAFPLLFDHQIVECLVISLLFILCIGRACDVESAAQGWPDGGHGELQRGMGGCGTRTTGRLTANEKQCAPYPLFSCQRICVLVARRWWLHHPQQRAFRADPNRKTAPPSVLVSFTFTASASYRQHTLTDARVVVYKQCPRLINSIRLCSQPVSAFSKLVTILCSTFPLHPDLPALAPQYHQANFSQHWSSVYNTPESTHTDLSRLLSSLVYL